MNLSALRPQSDLTCDARPQISILIPTWNNLPMLQICLEGIQAHTTVAFEVIVHVNEGQDGTREWLEKQGIRHTYSQENIGICAALNRAYLHAEADYIIYLNDDMYPLPEWETQLLEALAVSSHDTPAYASGTMIQPYSISPSTIVRDYGNGVDSFACQQLLQDFQSGLFAGADWNGATWPPSCVHRRWWDHVFGYSEEFTPGFYSDIDFSMKLWHCGCRRFHGVAGSLVYHFGEQSTKRIRGQKNSHVRRARQLFLHKWGVLPSTAAKYYFQAGTPFQACLPEPELGLERARLRLLASYYRCRRFAFGIAKPWTSSLPAEPHPTPANSEVEPTVQSGTE